MPHCQICGARLRRLHRTFAEKFVYMAVYECRQCRTLKPVPRRYTYFWGPFPRCPLCGTFRIRELAEPDPVDPMQRGLLHAMQRRMHGKLFHCRYCRVQFYDRRGTLSPDSNVIIEPPPFHPDPDRDSEAEPMSMPAIRPTEPEPPDTARSGA